MKVDPLFELKPELSRFKYKSVSTLDTKQFTWLLMLIPFSAVIIGFMLYLFRFQRGRRNSPVSNEPVYGPGFSAHRRGYRNPFDQPCRWMAVRSQDLAGVQQALGLVHPTPCSWEEGITEAGEHKLFVSPAINGWILVVGAGLPEPGDDVDKCHHFLMELSRKLGHVQFFSVNRVLNHHAWALIERGCVFRAYAWAGRTLWNQGPLTAAEKDVGMVCFDYATDPADYALQDTWTNNPEKIGRLAGWWSVDPSTIGEKASAARHGIVGDLSHSRPH